MTNANKQGEVVSFIDRRQERDAKRLVGMIADGRMDEFNAEILARTARTTRRRISTGNSVGTPGGVNPK